METLDISKYPSGDATHSTDRSLSADELRGLLGALISSSRDLNLRVWLDGVYTNIDNSEVRGEWMNGREVYFKVEGRVDRMERGHKP